MHDSLRVPLNAVHEAVYGAWGEGGTAQTADLGVLLAVHAQERQRRLNEIFGHWFEVDTFAGNEGIAVSADLDHVSVGDNRPESRLRRDRHQGRCLDWPVP